MCLIILCILLIVSVTIQAQCPTSCENILCFSDITQENCPPGEFLSPTGGVCGCCPACRGGVGLGGMCSPVVASLMCAPGLECQRTSGTCTLDKSQCTYTYHLDKSIEFVPECDRHGNFKAVQCEGEGETERCYCFDEDGQRIFGAQFRSHAANMTCTCSRLIDRFEKEGISHTVHCSDDGNFERLQCDSGICWCANAKTGHIELNTIAVPEFLWDLLPCCKFIDFNEYYKINVFKKYILKTA